MGTRDQGECSITLMFPPGAPSVECAVCGTISQFGAGGEGTRRHSALMAQIVCNGCSIQLMYPRSADSVLCSECHTVTPTAVPLVQEGQRRMVVIQNPDKDSGDALVVGYAPHAAAAPEGEAGALHGMQHHTHVPPGCAVGRVRRR